MKATPEQIETAVVAANTELLRQAQDRRMDSPYVDAETFAPMTRVDGQVDMRDLIAAVFGVAMTTEQTIIKQAVRVAKNEWRVYGGRILRVFDTCSRGLVSVSFVATDSNGGFAPVYWPAGQLWAEVKDDL